MSRSFRFLIMGPPGSGKGTISSRIVRDFNLCYVSSGDVLRSHILHKTKEGNEAKSFIEKGKLVPDELVSSLILDKIKLLSDKNWLLDGFPRTVKQAEMLSDICDIKGALSLNVPDEIIVSRLKGRWLHLPSGRIYNLEFNPPKIPGKDDVTGESLVQRDDDKPDVVLARLSNYHKENSPVLEYYRKKMLLEEFSGKESNEIWPRIKLFLEKIMKDAV